MRLLSPLCLLVLSFAGCAFTASTPSPSRSGNDKQSVAEQAAIATALEQLRNVKSNYAIAPGDLVGVSIFEQKALDREVRVGQDGSISLPLIGAVKLGAMTVAEAESLIADRFKDYIINPQISVFVKQYRKEKIYLIGEIGKPGSIDIPEETTLTVLEAIMLAGGFTRIAAPDRTKVIRMVEGKSRTIPVEVSEIMHRGQKQKDFAVQPNDVIFVPQSYF